MRIGKLQKIATENFVFKNIYLSGIGKGVMKKIIATFTDTNK